MMLWILYFLKFFILSYNYRIEKQPIQIKETTIIGIKEPATIQIKEPACTIKETTTIGIAKMSVLGQCLWVVSEFFQYFRLPKTI
jgi:hypothetical protein